MNTHTLNQVAGNQCQTFLSSRSLTINVASLPQSWIWSMRAWSGLPCLLAEYEAGKYAYRHVNSFQRDDAIVFWLACVAFKESPGKYHFIPRKGKRLQSGHELTLPARDSS